MTLKSIHKVADELLKKFDYQVIPVDPCRIAELLEISVVAFPMTNEISGMLVLEPDGATIGYNKEDSPNRIRFTIAHEIGHFMLHSSNVQNSKKVFVDNQFEVANHIQVLFRTKTPQSESENSQMEFEANTFAAALLMPETQLLKDLEDMEFDLGDDDALMSLSKKFNVSTSAMYYRLLNLRKG